MTKKKPMQEVRTDVWELSVDKEQKHQMVLTVEAYRKFLIPLVIVVNAQWCTLGELTSKERVNAVEKMIHKTVDNPNPKHKYFQKVIAKYPFFRKFPSYLRRAAIADAIGIVSSFQSRYYEWQSGTRKHKVRLPPKLTTMCKTYPALYRGQQVRYGLNYQTVDVKVWSGTDWIWLNNIKVKRHGLSRHLIDGNEIQSPALVVNKNKCQLSMPVQIKKVDKEDSDFVCSVDMGINNAATVSIVGKNGTVKARKFINPARDIDRRNQRRMMIKKKSSQTANLTKQKLPTGFCRGLYRKSANINLEISRQVMRGIVELAITHDVKVIVFENLSGWKAKAGRKGSLQKQKFHLWCHCKIVELTQQRWNELGGKVVFVNPKYTSAYAFDGSGKVRRSKINYSLAVFKNGKNYNCDLSSAYNIGARYWYAVIVGDKHATCFMPGNPSTAVAHFSRVFVGKSSNDTRLFASNSGYVEKSYGFLAKESPTILLAISWGAFKLILLRRLNMKQIIDKIYETGSVVGRSGQVHKLHSAIDREEGEFLFSLIHDDPTIRNTLEVGCAYGLSSLQICLAMRDRAGASHTIIDPFQNIHWDGAGIKNLETAGIDFFNLIEIKSEFALPQLLEKHEAQFDFVFIDGWHTFDHTLLDCFYATRLLRVGGVLAIDDVSLPSVKRVVDFLKNYPCYEEHGSVGYTVPKTWIKIVARGLGSAINQKTWASVLAPNLYRRIFDDRHTKMIALRKTKEDSRKWDWHVDAF